ncbi:hypothetical protein EVAR_7161_1 [Eumeta japonica]|uniref:Uncharacterized protein n=1 Tax=Eumeta variegata TaxID=151549 RepID=A0A4C1U7W7_EUMVA|nr:hypothetical protein EVAR_7161_1 [Eumeta japonica]
MYTGNGRGVTDVFPDSLVGIGCLMKDQSAITAFMMNYLILEINEENEGLFKSSFDSLTLQNSAAAPRVLGHASVTAHVRIMDALHVGTYVACLISKCKWDREPSESRWSPSPMETHIPKGVTNVCNGGRVGLIYGERIFGLLQTERNTTRKRTSITFTKNHATQQLMTKEELLKACLSAERAADRRLTTDSDRPHLYA